MLSSGWNSDLTKFDTSLSFSLPWSPVVYFCTVLLEISPPFMTEQYPYFADITNMKPKSLDNWILHFGWIWMLRMDDKMTDEIFIPSLWMAGWPMTEKTKEWMLFLWMYKAYVILSIVWKETTATNVCAPIKGSVFISLLWSQHP